MLLDPLILFICINVAPFSFTMINITTVCQIWNRFYKVTKIVAILEYFSDGGFMPFLAFWHYFLDLNLFSWSNLAKLLTNFVRIKCIHKWNTSGTHISIFFEIFDKWRYKNVLIQEATIAKILNFDVAIFRNEVLIRPILFICIKVLSLSFTIIYITRVCQIWIRFYRAAKIETILGYFTVCDMYHVWPCIIEIWKWDT